MADSINSMDPSLFPKQASQIWEMLDDMAAHDPEGYAKFMQQNMEKGAELFTKPKSEACIRTDFHTPPNKSVSKYIYVNIFTWKQISKPKNSQSPVPMTCSEMKMLSTGGTDVFVIAVAVNPSVYFECCEDKTDLKDLFELILSYVKDMRKLDIGSEFSRLKTACKGDPSLSSNWLYEMVFAKSLPKKYSTPAEDDNVSNSAIIDQLSKLTISNSENSQATEKVEKKLIEEISEQKFEKEKPLYTCSVKTCENQEVLKLCITLPKIESVDELDLQISRDEVHLSSESYQLSISLEREVDETSVKAKFEKSKHLLRISINCLS